MKTLQTPKIKITQSSDVSVSWSWYDQQNGIVQWTFQNISNNEQSVALLRGAVDQNGQVLLDYYFGNAYWVVYLGLCITTWQTGNQSLQDEGVQQNAPPLAVLESHGKYIVAFIFTLPPNSTWSMLEGGFGNGVQPYQPIAIPATYEGDQNFCIGYDYTQILDYVEQTGVPVAGYQPNPAPITTSLYKIAGPYIELFNDSIQLGNCPQLTWWQRIENFFKRIF